MAGLALEGIKLYLDVALDRIPISNVCRSCGRWFTPARVGAKPVTNLMTPKIIFQPRQRL